MKTLPPVLQPRHEVVDACAECGDCAGGVHCAAAREPVLRKYPGVRLTADGFDCALPVTIDSHSACSFACIYCFSDNLSGHLQSGAKGLGETPLDGIEGIFTGRTDSKLAHVVRKALKYDRSNAAGFPCPVQVGGLNDPGDNIERQRGWFLRFGDLAIRHNQPVRASTKGTVFAEADYMRMFARAPHLFWVAFSIISPDDDLMRKIDEGAPPPSERLRVMKALSKLGVSTSLRLRPMFPGATDATRKHPHAYRELIERAADAGAKAISYECGFFPSRIPKDRQPRWQELERLLGVPLRRVYTAFGLQACTRPHYTWVENIMHAVKEVAVAQGMTVGVSDPVWKQLGESGCCCGIRPDDPVFGNWERENACHALLEAKRDGHTIRAAEIVPPWADDWLLENMCVQGVGPRATYARNRKRTWGDKLREQWNDPRSERGPLTYFQGALRPVRLDDGEVGYKYVGLERQHPQHVPYWDDELARASEPGMGSRPVVSPEPAPAPVPRTALPADDDDDAPAADYAPT